MNKKDVVISGLVCEYPEFRYTTNDMFNVIGDKISETVKNNILKLGVDSRHFVRPIEDYLDIPKESINVRYGSEPISDISTSVGNKCLDMLGLKKDEITCLVAASENNDYQSPGLSSIVLTKMGFSNFTPHFNIQGMACSTFPKVLELGKNLVHDENDKILVVISGCNSGWYMPHLKENKPILNPSEIEKDDPDKEQKTRKWISTMFSFLFGDGVCAFLLSQENKLNNSIRIGKFTHGINFNKFDYQKAAVKLVGNKSDYFYNYQLTSDSGIMERCLDYSKRVIMQSMGKNPDHFDLDAAKKYLSKQNKIFMHTGSLKIIDALKNLYELRDDQIIESYQTLKEYGNLTGVSIPTVLNKSLMKNNSLSGENILIGITMGFGIDIVEVNQS